MKPSTFKRVLRFLSEVKATKFFKKKRSGNTDRKI